VRAELGLQWRADRAQVGLYDTIARVRTAATRDDAVRQGHLAAYGEAEVEWMPGLRSVIGLRADRHRFRVDSDLDANDGRAQAQQLSPKLALVAGPWQRTELFFNAGRGFHSNDARGTTTRVDPKTGDPAQPVPGLVAVRGSELGLRTAPAKGMEISLALWRLQSDSELVYVGDAGATEPNRPSRRSGLEWNNRWRPTAWLLLDADFAWSRGRFTESAPEGERIPGSVARVAALAATLKPAPGWSASLALRHLGERVLTEDGGVRAPANTLTNLRLVHALGRNAELGLDVFNLLDRRVNDIEYFYESRLAGEAAPVADRHVHPAEPRTVRLTLQVRL
jgi:outer membrane receptor protein involved in Fe transport